MRNRRYQLLQYHHAGGYHFSLAHLISLQIFGDIDIDMLLFLPSRILFASTPLLAVSASRHFAAALRSTAKDIR